MDSTGKGKDSKALCPRCLRINLWAPVGFPYMLLKVEFNKPFVFLAKNFTFLLLPWVH